MKRNTNHVIPPCVSPEKENAINDNETIYPIEPIYINVLLPKRSIRYQPTRVKIKFTTPIPTLDRNALLFSVVQNFLSHGSVRQPVLHSLRKLFLLLLHHSCKVSAIVGFQE